MARKWPLVGRDEDLARIAKALRDPQISCVLLTGDAGVGKTRLARETVARDRWHVRWAIATEQARAIPLGALAPLLPGTNPESGSGDRLRMLGWARRIVLTGRPQRDLLIVDDAAQLDDLTAALVQQLAREHTSTRLLLTARTADMPEWLAALARDDGVEHIDVRALAEDQASALVEAVLGGPADAATHALLWTHSGGNPLWLRQLVVQGIDSGALRLRDRFFRWEGPIGAGDLDQLFATRIERIPDAEARVLDLVAVGEPLPADVIAELGIEAQIDELGRRGLVEQDAGGRVRMAHPLYGSATRARLSTIARHGAERRLADAFAARGPLSGSDLPRVARWRLDVGDIADAALMLAAAQRTLLVDSRLAERFARAASETDTGYPALHALSRALFDQSRMREAEQVYRRIVGGALSTDERLGVTLELSMIRAWGGHDATGAIEELRTAGERAEFAPHVSVIAGMRAALELFHGEPRTALETALPIVEDAGHPVRTRFLAALAVVPALALTGRAAEALRLAEWACAVSPEEDFSGPVPFGPTFAHAQLMWGYVFALRWAGRIDEAVAAAATALQQAAQEPQRHLQSYGLLNAATGSARLAAGNVRDARGALAVGASALRESDVTGSVVSALADLGRAEALAGNAETAGALIAEAAERTTAATRVFDASLRRACAVAAAMDGDLARARAEALAGARRAQDAGEAVLEAACLHLLVRFGEARSARDRLAEIAESGDAELVKIFAAHAEAAVRRDASELERVADRFDAAGARMLAAHTAAAAARTYRRAGRTAAANRAAQRSRSYSAQCPEAPAPLLLEEPVPLTARERAIVDLARRGSTNRQIAESLSLSVRTVESHLQHAYRKLGLRSRADLAD